MYSVSYTHLDVYKRQTWNDQGSPHEEIANDKSNNRQVKLFNTVTHTGIKTI